MQAMAESIQLHDKSFNIFIEEKDLLAKIDVLAAYINQEYESITPLFLVVLNGAFMFASELIGRYKGPCRLAFVSIRSYQGMKSSGKVNVSGLDPEAVRDQEVIIIEDIIDSGRTLHEFMLILKNMGPKSVKIATLLSKPGALQFPIPVSYCGFEISDEFVVGFGLDYDGLGRNLRDIYQVVSDT